MLSGFGGSEDLNQNDFPVRYGYRLAQKSGKENILKSLLAENWFLTRTSALFLLDSHWPT